MPGRHLDQPGAGKRGSQLDTGAWGQRDVPRSLHHDGGDVGVRDGRAEQLVVAHQEALLQGGRRPDPALAPDGDSETGLPDGLLVEPAAARARQRGRQPDRSMLRDAGADGQQRA